jgi:hypothetical protein
MLSSICQSLHKLINTGYRYLLPVLRVRDVYPVPDPNFFHPGFRIQGWKRHRIRIRNTAYYCSILSTTGSSPLIYIYGIFRSVCGRSSWRVICTKRAGPCGRAARRVPLRAVVRVQSAGVPLRAVVGVQNVRVHGTEVLDNTRVNTRIQCCRSGSGINSPDPQHCSNTNNEQL